MARSSSNRKLGVKSLVKALSIGASRFCQQPSVPWRTQGAGPATAGIRAWLLAGTGYSQVTEPSRGQLLVLSQDSSWAEASACDMIAHREAAIESLVPLQHGLGDDQLVAWPLLACYYSTYFAAQALLRCLGLGTVYLGTDEASRLAAAWNMRGFPSSVSPGNYCFCITLSAPASITLRRIGGAGGAHQQFWTGFEQLRRDIQEVLLTSPALSILDPLVRQAADAEYDRLMESFFQTQLAGSCGLDYGWLSSHRNSVNYRFAGNCWRMNWHSSAGTVSELRRILDRFGSGSRSLPASSSDFSGRHVVFVAARLCKVISESTLGFRRP